MASALRFSVSLSILLSLALRGSHVKTSKGQPYETARSKTNNDGRERVFLYAVTRCFNNIAHRFFYFVIGAFCCGPDAFDNFGKGLTSLINGVRYGLFHRLGKRV